MKRSYYYFFFLFTIINSLFLLSVGSSFGIILTLLVRAFNPSKLLPTFVLIRSAITQVLAPLPFLLVYRESPFHPELCPGQKVTIKGQDAPPGALSLFLASEYAWSAASAILTSLASTRILQTGYVGGC